MAARVEAEDWRSFPRGKVQKIGERPPPGQRSIHTASDMAKDGKDCRERNRGRGVVFVAEAELLMEDDGWGLQR
ncbi:hypothetical protein NC653_023209 [Populus alba x Populus x berolinensis]|uniref:Uncharacterized protein n=1 Tax=Populus alba x Populus x berolinensis TaxID=444605 RepID=A0AAD6QBU4_9ROSI|nr:hypothetical protein NC653_023209 [Populus alba x Populus x berolinensis]